MSDNPKPAVVVVIRITDSDELTPLVTQVEDIAGSGALRFVFDLDAVAFVNSAMLGYFVRTAEEQKGRGGGLVLARPSKLLSKSLEVLGLEATLTTAATLDEAVDRSWRASS